VNPSELGFWLDWYDAFDAALAGGEGAIAVVRGPDGRVSHRADARLLPALHEVRELFLRAGAVNVVAPREAAGTQVWPANGRETEAGGALVRLVEEPAWLAQEDGFRAADPEAPAPLRRLIDVLEAHAFSLAHADEIAERCPAWPRIVPELFEAGVERLLAEALPCFDLLPKARVRDVLLHHGLPPEIMSPFVPYVRKDLSLRRLVWEEEAKPEE
jgi:hypothetical protein